MVNTRRPSDCRFSPRLPFAGFNPYTDTPKQYHVGDDPNQVYNYMLDPTYGKATNKDAYQLPQTYRIAVGFRF